MKLVCVDVDIEDDDVELEPEEPPQAAPPLLTPVSMYRPSGISDIWEINFYIFSYIVFPETKDILSAKPGRSEILNFLNSDLILDGQIFKSIRILSS